MNRYLFVGPSLPDAATLVDADVQVLPPIQAGDILRLPLSPDDVVGIVDGYFHQRPAVRHKEILSVLADGARVLGAASIGALRAAELDRYGMEGVGEIYRAYRDNELAADDEVALMHGPPDDNYRPLSEPLVNIRATLAAAIREGLLDEATRDDLIESLATSPYAARNYERVAELAAVHGVDGSALRTFCRERAVDRKRADALELVQLLREARPHGEQRTFKLNRTIYLQGWQLAASVTDTGDGCGPISDLDVLRACQLYAEDFPEFYRDWVLQQISDECARNCHEYDESRTQVETAIAHGIHTSLYGDVSDWAAFMHGWLDSADRDLEAGNDAELFLTRSYLVGPGVRDLTTLSEAVLSSRAVAAARQLVRAADHVNEQSKRLDLTFDLQGIAGWRIIDWFAVHWSRRPKDLDLAALDRGIDSHAALVTAARPYYLAARFNPELTRFRMTTD
jgi:hypothetical protein